MEIYSDNINFKPSVTIQKEIQNKKKSISFKQQKLITCQPILTINTVLPCFLAIGIILLPTGFFLLNISNQVQEFVLNYTDCVDIKSNLKCSDVLKNNITNSILNPCICEIIFDLKEPIYKNVYFYYALSNYYQNHRRYVRSRNNWQLLGYTENLKYSNCIPFDFRYDEKFKKKKPIAPCGAIANSLFNDTFELIYLDKKIDVKFIENGISWPTDNLYKFKNPDPLSKLDIFTHPNNWNVYLQNLKSGNKVAFENEHLIVWMRTAALPKFRKLYSKIDHSSNKIFENSLCKGKYKLIINYNYLVSDFNGTKSFVLSNTSWLGGKNPFLGIAYIVTGSICICSVGILFILYQKYGVRQNDMVNVNINTPFNFNDNL